MTAPAPRYERMPLEAYFTPPHAVLSLCRSPAWALLDGLGVWEPCCGDGQIVNVVKHYAPRVVATDIHDHGCPGWSWRDFSSFGPREHPPEGCRAIITNLPYGGKDNPGLGDRLALAALDHPEIDTVALLFPIHWSAGPTRAGLVNRSTYRAKIELRKRLVWTNIKASHDKRRNRPKHHFAWYVWSRLSRPLPITPVVFHS